MFDITTKDLVVAVAPNARMPRAARVCEPPKGLPIVQCFFKGAFCIKFQGGFVYKGFLK